jgi:hypothetical protein
MEVGGAKGSPGDKLDDVPVDVGTDRFHQVERE